MGWGDRIEIRIHSADIAIPAPKNKEPLTGLRKEMGNQIPNRRQVRQRFRVLFSLKAPIFLNWIRRHYVLIIDIIRTIV